MALPARYSCTNPMTVLRTTTASTMKPSVTLSIRTASVAAASRT